jgi:hypothetical protein
MACFKNALPTLPVPPNNAIFITNSPAFFFHFTSFTGEEKTYSVPIWLH